MSQALVHLYSHVPISQSQQPPEPVVVSYLTKNPARTSVKELSEKKKKEENANKKMKKIRTSNPTALNSLQ